jgi:hypothetical protein
LASTTSPSTRQDLWLQATAEVAQLLLGKVDRDQAMRLADRLAAASLGR